MKKSFKIFIVCCSLLFTMFVTACASGTTTGSVGTQAPTVSPTRTNTHLNHLLQKSKTAMANLQTVHFELDAISQPEASLSGAAADLLQALQPLPGMPPYIETKGSGDMVAPDLSHISTATTMKGVAPCCSTMHNVVQKDNVYLPGADNNWYMISKENLLATAHTSVYAQDGRSQVNALLDLSLQKGTLHDNGTGDLEGKSLHHIQVTFQKDAFQDLLNIDIQNATYPLSKVNRFKNITATTDFWIDDNTGYIYQVINTMKLDPIRVQTLSFQYSAFNQPTTIQLPAHPIPVNSIDQIPASMEVNY